MFRNVVGIALLALILAGFVTLRTMQALPDDSVNVAGATACGILPLRPGCVASLRAPRA
jgi:hypothetical protein